MTVSMSPLVSILLDNSTLALSVNEMKWKVSPILRFSLRKGPDTKAETASYELLMLDDASSITTTSLGLCGQRGSASAAISTEIRLILFIDFPFLPSERRSANLLNDVGLFLIVDGKIKLLPDFFV